MFYLFSFQDRASDDNEDSKQLPTETTTTKVYIGNLSSNVTKDDLKRLFAPYGTISDCNTASRCGFVYLEDKTLALKAIDELNNTNFMGGRIIVEMGRRRDTSGRNFKGNRNPNYRSAPYDGRGRNMNRDSRFGNSRPIQPFSNQNNNSGGGGGGGFFNKHIPSLFDNNNPGNIIENLLQYNRLNNNNNNNNGQNGLSTYIELLI